MLRQETVVGWVLKEFYKRMDINMFCQNVNVLEVESIIVKYIVLMCFDLSLNQR